MLPLQGVRVVEAAQMIAGPLAGMVLAEQGADVVKVELPDGRGDRMRYLGTRRRDVSALFHACNRGKRSIVLDSKTEDGLAAMRALCARADVFLQNFRPGAAERLGLGEAELRAENPDLVYVSVSGFGASGPRSGEKVYDYVIQAMTGMADLQGDGDGAPALIKNAVVDKVTALTVSQAITAALYQRERGHGGQHIELSMLDAGLWFLWPDGFMDRAMVGDDVTHGPRFGDLVDVRATRDGFVSLVAMGGRTWPGLCAAFNPHWLDDPRFAHDRDRELNAAVLSDELGAVIGRLTTAECLGRMRANDVPGAAVTPLDEVSDDPQIVHNDSLIVRENGPAGHIREVRAPVAFGGAQRPVPDAAPHLGEHSREILLELGYTDEQVDGLGARGVLGPEHRAT
jgi:crotonobetainyl-CoA:carnitine CoA-transferase CaiB-like acyl-CoA transferase